MYWANEPIRAEVLKQKGITAKYSSPEGRDIPPVFKAPDAHWTNAVFVVPNPYHVRAFEKYSGRQLKFLNLPPYANIHIYTMTGDLVYTIEHTTGTGDASWDRQDTFSTMEIVSGVYIYVVEQLDGPSGSATGEIAMGKFVVVK